MAVPQSPGPATRRNARPTAQNSTAIGATARATSRSTPMSERIVHVGDEDFQEQVLNAGEPVLVDFWAEWCGPCKAIAPLLDELAEEYAGRLKVAKVNIEEAQRTPLAYSIRSIPTLIVFRDGKPHATQIGLAAGNARAALRQFVDKAIA